MTNDPTPARAGPGPARAMGLPLLWLTLAAAAAVALIALVAAPEPDSRADPRPAPRAVGPEPASAAGPPSPRARARTAALPHLDRADAECRAALEAQLLDVEAAFAAARARTPELADRLLAWPARWALARDRLGLGTGEHAALVRAALADVLFTPAELAGLADRAAGGYAEAVQAAEDRLTLGLGLELEDIDGLAGLVDTATLGTALRQAAGPLPDRAAAGLGEQVARELVALALGELAAQAAVRLGTSAGLIGAGAAGSAATFGAGLLAAVAADALLEEVWDARGALAADLARRVDRLRDEVLEGTPQAPGLRAHLERLDRERAAVRRAAVLDRLGDEEGGP